MSGVPSSMDVSHGRAFVDRRQAGRALAERLQGFAAEHPVVLGLPRGGVPVGIEIATALHAPFDVLVARKVGAPGNPELGIGAVAENGVRVLGEQAIASLGVTDEELAQAVARAEQELADRVRRYRAGRSPLSLVGRTAIVVDDGLATGGTARAALRAARRCGARRVVLAVPLGAPSTLAALGEEASEIVCLLTPDPLWAIGLWYEDFAQVSDEEVRALLARGAPPPPPAPAA